MDKGEMVLSEPSKTGLWKRGHLTGPVAQEGCRDHQNHSKARGGQGSAVDTFQLLSKQEAKGQGSFGEAVGKISFLEHKQGGESVWRWRKQHRKFCESLLYSVGLFWTHSVVGCLGETS